MIPVRLSPFSGRRLEKGSPANTAKPAGTKKKSAVEASTQGVSAIHRISWQESSDIRPLGGAVIPAIECQTTPSAWIRKKEKNLGFYPVAGDLGARRPHEEEVLLSGQVSSFRGSRAR